MASNNDKHGNVAAALEGSAARKIAPLTPARSLLDEPEVFGHGRDERLKNYASNFLLDKLPEALAPTEKERRLQAALVWGEDHFLELVEIQPGKALTVGASKGATFDIDVGSAKAVLPLVQPKGNGFSLLVPAEGGSVFVDGKEQSAKELIESGRAAQVQIPTAGAALELGLNDRYTARFGNLTVYARYTKPQPSKKRPLGERIDSNFISTLVILFLAAFTLERMVAITDFSTLNLSDDLFKNKDLFARYIAKSEVEEETKFEDLSGVEEGAKAADEEGKFGKEEAVQAEAAPSKEGAPEVDVDKREEDRQKVMSSGLVALLGGEGMGDAASNVFGPGGIGTGINEALGGIDGGGAMGDAQGVGGLGARGGGSGGGGTGLGIGGLGGAGSGRGRGGSGAVDFGGRGKRGTRFIPGKTTILGGLSQEVVGQIVRRHWNEIKYCYERELAKDPNLEGKVAVSFQIGPVGSVIRTTIAETTLGNSAAEQCMLNQVKKWRFPAPEGGGVVDVTYPFIFRTS